MSAPFVDLYKHNLWANLKLLDVCSPLSDEQLEAGAAGTYGTVKNTLVHMVAAERRYVAMLRGEQPDRTIHESLGFPGIDALRESAQQSGQALIQIAEREQTGRILSGEWRGEPFTINISIPLIQAINHATEHRAHIMTVLSQNSVEVPELDGWSFEDALKEG